MTEAHRWEQEYIWLSELAKWVASHLPGRLRTWFPHLSRGSLQSHLSRSGEALYMVCSQQIQISSDWSGHYTQSQWSRVSALCHLPQLLMHSPQDTQQSLLVYIPLTHQQWDWLCPTLPSSFTVGISHMLIYIKNTFLSRYETWHAVDLRSEGEMAIMRGIDKASANSGFPFSSRWEGTLKVM